MRRSFIYSKWQLLYYQSGVLYISFPMSLEVLVSSVHLSVAAIHAFISAVCDLCAHGLLRAYIDEDNNKNMVRIKDNKSGIH